MTLKLYLLLCEQIFVVHTFKGRDKKFVESPKSKEKVKAYSKSYKVAHYRFNQDLVTVSQLFIPAVRDEGHHGQGKWGGMI